MLMGLYTFSALLSLTFMSLGCIIPCLIFAAIAAALCFRSEVGRGLCKLHAEETPAERLPCVRWFMRQDLNR